MPSDSLTFNAGVDTKSPLSKPTYFSIMGLDSIETTVMPLSLDGTAALAALTAAGSAAAASITTRCLTVWVAPSTVPSNSYEPAGSCAKVAGASAPFNFQVTFSCLVVPLSGVAATV